MRHPVSAAAPASVARLAYRLALLAAIATLFTILTASRVAAQQRATLASIRNLEPAEVRSGGFVLAQPGTVRIEAVGAGPRDNRDFWDRAAAVFDRNVRHDTDEPWQGNAWILDARTRAVVWELRRAEGDGRGLRDFGGEVRLPAGTYEVYYASYPNGAANQRGGWFDRRTSDLAHEFKITVSGDGRALTGTELAQARQDFNKTAFVSLTNIGPSRVKHTGFILDRPTEIDVYAIGEAREDAEFDYGMIVNADTRERVWELHYTGSEPAGGAAKNRLDHRTLRLQPGRYGVTVMTDDSHDASAWNSAPPFDPTFYGLTLRVRNPADAERVKTFAYDPAPTGKAFVDLTRVHDSELRSSGFTLSKPMDVRVYALGEGSDNRMSDYGWIVDANTRRKVWSMDADATMHAGGATKNRMVDRVLKLDRGSYIVYYMTDDSHSFDDWNAAQPMDPAHWGISLYPINDADRSAVTPYDEKKDASVIAEVTRVRDDDHVRTRFVLDRDTDVRIYALGEASGDEFVDYGWIEDAATGRRVWTMRVEDSEPAGGAKKNRQVVDLLKLKAGEYNLHYRTDGSHAFGSWNAEAPSDPGRWGITLYRAK